MNYDSQVIGWFHLPATTATAMATVIVEDRPKIVKSQFDVSQLEKKKQPNKSKRFE